MWDDGVADGQDIVSVRQLDSDGQADRLGMMAYRWSDSDRISDGLNTGQTGVVTDGQVITAM